MTMRDADAFGKSPEAKVAEDLLDGGSPAAGSSEAYVAMFDSPPSDLNMNTYAAARPSTGEAMLLVDTIHKERAVTPSNPDGFEQDPKTATLKHDIGLQKTDTNSISAAEHATFHRRPATNAISQRQQVFIKGPSRQGRMEQAERLSTNTSNVISSSKLNYLPHLLAADAAPPEAHQLNLNMIRVAPERYEDALLKQRRDQLVRISQEHQNILQIIANQQPVATASMQSIHAGLLPHEELARIEEASRLHTLYHTENVALMMRPEQRRFRPERRSKESN